MTLLALVVVTAISAVSILTLRNCERGKDTCLEYITTKYDTDVCVKRSTD